MVKVEVRDGGKLARAPGVSLETLSLETDLSLTHENLKDISLLSKMESLRSVNLAFNKIRSLAGLKVCTSLEVLHISHNVLSSLESLPQAPFLRIVTVSHNKIKSLAPLAGRDSVQDLWIQKNSISDLREIRHLQKMPGLRRLVLRPNPLCRTCGTPESYRSLLINALPQLAQLDGKTIDDQERNQAKIWAQSAYASSLKNMLEGKDTTPLGIPPPKSKSKSSKINRASRLSLSHGNRTSRNGGKKQSCSRNIISSCSNVNSSAVKPNPNSNPKPKPRVRGSSRDRRERKIARLSTKPRRSLVNAKISEISSKISSQEEKNNEIQLQVADSGRSTARLTRKNKNNIVKMAAEKKGSMERKTNGNKQKKQITMTDAVTCLPDLNERLRRTKLPRSDIKRTFAPHPPKNKNKIKTSDRNSSGHFQSENSKESESQSQEAEDTTAKYLKEAKQRVKALTAMQGVAAMQIQLAANIRRRMSCIEDKLSEARELEEPPRERKTTQNKASFENTKPKQKSAVRPELKPFRETLKERKRQKERLLKSKHTKAVEILPNHSSENGGGIAARINAAVADFDKDTSEVFARLRNKLGWKIA